MARGLGQWGEDTAAAYLEDKGYASVDRNWRCMAGEMDLIMRDGEAWVFVEVKARRSGAFGLPQEAVTADKQQRLLDIALTYLSENELHDVDWRVDVIAIATSTDGGQPEVTHFQNAVGEW